MPSKKPAAFRRKQLVLQKPIQANLAEKRTISDSVPTLIIENNLELEERAFLIANASQSMAKEITLQLSLAIPGCSLIYAPTIEIAKLVLKKRSIDLVISSPMLPDGPVDTLRNELEMVNPPPDLIVVGDKSQLDINLLKRSIYKISRIEMFGERSEPEGLVEKLKDKEPIVEKVKSLGADIRNDLNNPLQEIVAMVFIARSSGDKNAMTDIALDAIDRAAQSMADVVVKIEDKIRQNIS